MAEFVKRLNNLGRISEFGRNEVVTPNNNQRSHEKGKPPVTEGRKANGSETAQTAGFPNVIEGVRFFSPLIPS
jgi:hypothetical protein